MNEQTNSARQEPDRALLMGGLKGSLAGAFCVMQTGLETLQTYLRVKADPEVAGHADKIIAGITGQMAALERLTANLTDALASRSGELKASVQPMELERELERLCGFVRQEIAARGWQAELTTALNSSKMPAVVLGDPALADAVFANLFSNSLRYAGAEPKLFVTVAQEENRVRVTLRDSGPGIPEEIAAHALSAQWVPGGLEEQNFDGLGLSLAVCYSRAMGWEIEIKSGAGAEIVLTAPCAQVSPREAVLLHSGVMSENAAAARQRARIRLELDGVFGPAGR